MRSSLCLIVAVSLAACQRGPEDTLARADELLALGHAPQSAQVLRRLASVAAGDAVTPALVRLARINTFTLGDAPQALADWTALRARGDISPGLRLEAIRQSADLLRSQLRRPDEAVTLLREARDQLGAHPEGAAVRAELLAVLVELNDFEAAAEEATALIERFPLSAEAHGARLAQGQAAYLAGAHAHALAAYQDLIDSHPPAEMEAVALVGAGDCFEELGEGPRALERYYAALKEHPNPALVQAKVARVRARLYHLAPQDRILNATRPSRHVAAWQPRPTPADLGFDRVPPRHTVRLAPSRP